MAATGFLHLTINNRGAGHDSVPSIQHVAELHVSVEGSIRYMLQALLLCCFNIEVQLRTMLQAIEHAASDLVVLAIIYVFVMFKCSDMKRVCIGLP